MLLEHRAAARLGGVGMPETIIALKEVHKWFAGVHALRGVSLRLERGEVHSLVGENGSGKSTLIKIIAGVHAPDRGEVLINGKVYPRLTPLDAIREGVQVIYQDFSLFPNLSVAENIVLTRALAAGQRWIDRRQMREQARAAMARIGVELDLEAPVEELPVAQKQLVAICRALVDNARLIIMDEATTALTEREIRALFEVVKALKAQGIATLFVSHKLNEVLEIADNVTIVRNGTVVAAGPVAQYSRSALIRHMTGRDVDEMTYQGPQKPSGDPVLEVRGLGKAGRFFDVSFRLHAGEVLGLAGVLGAGRTDLALALFGLRPADEGEIRIDGRPVKIRSVRDAIAHRIAYVPEDRLTEGLFMSQSIGRNILVSSLDRLAGRASVVDRAQAQAMVARWIREFRIVTPSAEQPVETLSGGNQQRVVLSRWLATSPRILILNGPTVGVDVGSKSEIHETIQELARGGMAVLLISDDLREVLQNCNRILVMKDGRLVAEHQAGAVTEAELARQLSGG